MQIVRELEDRAMADAVGRKFDDARVSYRLQSNQVSSEDEFYRILGDYYNHVHSCCITPGAKLADYDATQKAINLLEEALRRDNGNIRSAYSNAVEGLNGGVMKILDIITDALRHEAMQNYTEHILRKYISPLQWEQQVDAIRSLLNHYSRDLPSDIDAANPEKYARDYSRLIKGLVYSINQTAREFRRY